MKRLLIILSFVSLAFVSQGQTPGFPSIDSLSRYNNRYINNSAIEAFANMRLNTLLHGIIWWIDTAINRSGETIFETDTIVVLPGGHGNGNGNGGGKPGGIRYNDTLFIFEVSKDTIWQSLLIETANGLSKNLDTVLWGGELDRETVIDQDENGITFHDGIFRHYIGDVETYLSPYSDFQRSLYSTTFDGDPGTGEANYQFSMSSVPALKGYIQMATYGPDGSARLTLQNDAISLYQQNGKLFMPNLIDSVQAYQLYISPDGWKVTYGLPSGGGGGGGGGGVSHAVFTNGMTNVNDSTGKLGGTLTETTTINNGGFALNVTGAVSGGSSLTGTNTQASGTVHGLYGTATASTGGIGIRGDGGSIGVRGFSTNGTGGSFSSTNGIGISGIGLIGGSFEIVPASTNTAAQINRHLRGTTGTAANNIGGYSTYDIETSDGNYYTAARHGAVWTDATTGTRSGRYDIWTTNSATESRKFSVSGDGTISLVNYGAGTFEAAATYILGVNGSGDVVEVAAGDLGGGTGGVTPTELDTDYFDGDGSTINPYTPDWAIFASQTDIATVNTRIDSLLNNFPAGALITDIEDVNDRIDSLLNDFPSGSAEDNMITATITTTADRTLSAESILQYVLVKPTTSLTAFKVGTTSDDDKYVTATPVTAGTDFVVFGVGAHIPATALTIRISGITSSTQIKLIYKTLHE